MSSNRESDKSIELAIADVFKEVFLRETGGRGAPILEENTVLLETGLDSLGFGVLIVELEDRLGFDPFSLSLEPYYPETFGELVRFYVSNHPG